MITTGLCVVGLGPAGRALTDRALAAGIDTTAVDPAPDRRWRPTYAAWADELPDRLDPAAVGARFAPGAYGHAEHHPDREYVVLDTGGLQRSLTVDGARVIADAAAVVEPHRVVTRDGTTVTADVVIDARGAPVDPRRAQQTAVGVVVDRAEAEPRLQGCWLMDWRADHGAGESAPPSFLYAVALDADRMLLEETCLVGRPALGLRELRRRLETRLAGHGITLTGDEPVEHVRFATQPDPADLRPGRALTVGARGGLMHPATGYSVATGLTLAPVLAAAIAAGADPRAAVWTRGARFTARLRAAGLRTLLALDADGTRTFFDAFFRLPLGWQRSYLSDRADPRGTMAAMASLAAHLPPRLVGVALRESAREALPG